MKALIFSVILCALTNPTWAQKSATKEMDKVVDVKEVDVLDPKAEMLKTIGDAIDAYIEKVVDKKVLPDPDPEPVADKPVFFEWWYNYPGSADGIPLHKPEDPSVYVDVEPSNGSLRYSPLPQPEGAHGIGFGGWKSWFMIETMRQQAENGDPVSFLLRERNSPYPYDANGNTTEPKALQNALDNISKLDYLVMDLEADPEMVQKNIREIVRIVRAHPNPEIANAWIGNYNDYAGDVSEGHIWPNQKIRGGDDWRRGEFYLDSGMNVSMPVLYPYQAYSVHAHPRYGNPPAPNSRAANLWAPLEHLSVAARNLPEGHKLIPWVGNWVPYSGASSLYNAAPPPIEDLQAMIAHVYLRGADGCAVWLSNKDKTNHPTVDRETYKAMVLRIWAEMDNAFNGEQIDEVLTLNTSKITGVQWSAAMSKTKVVVFVSNLSGTRTGASIPLPVGLGLPERTPRVPDGSHAMFAFDRK